MVKTKTTFQILLSELILPVEFIGYALNPAVRLIRDFNKPP